ncbi:tripartite motif-containing protein 3 [Biomphalaria pfeifferi]|uniref:Tripartite motif-containing protein 3 n=1 Tax=Biomphalaria pfeifferi TaxID=112525 RepID=A0AAD8B1M0_BIOPF|nr:tripartite motif-containing protein 3 [Biomphalaria pfeifferi]
MDASREGLKAALIQSKRIKRYWSRQVPCDSSSSRAKSIMSRSAAALAVSRGPETSKSFFIDEDIFHEQFLSCSVCNEGYNQKERAPKLLTCNHTFCLTCLLTIYDQPKEPHLPYRPVEDKIFRTLNFQMCRKANLLNGKSIN